MKRARLDKNKQDIQKDLDAAEAKFEENKVEAMKKLSQDDISKAKE